MRRTTVLGSLVALVLLMVAGCGRADPALVKDVESTGLTVFLPELGDAEPVSLVVEGGTVSLVYKQSDLPDLTVRFVPLPDGSLCRGIDRLAGSDCSESYGVMRSDMEEMTTVAVARGDTAVVASGLVTEANPGVADATVASFQDAREVSAEELVEAVD